MKQITSIVRSNHLYFISLTTMLVAGCIFLLMQGKSAAFISLNAWHPFWLNVFFINYTFIGDGIFAVCLIAVLYFYSRKKQLAITLLYSFIISGFIVQSLKNLVNSSVPEVYFEAGTYLNFIDGVTTHTGNNGFPSGHTATAFAIATVTVSMFANKKWHWLILSAAALVGYSRIYLAQHFLIDVIIGASVGTVSGIIAVYLAQNKVDIKRSFNKLHRIRKKTATTNGPVQTATG